MGANLPQLLDREAPVFTISVAAQLAGMHPQTLRTYDRLGLVSPRRARGRGRRYSPNDIAKLRLIQQLSQEDGINLPGIRRILTLRAELEASQRHVATLMGIIKELQADDGGRLFTADRHGAVGLGRVRRFAPPPRALGR